MESRAAAFRSWTRDLERALGWTPIARVRLSLEATAVGWAAICLVFLGYTLVARQSSFYLLSLATGAVVAVGWLVLGVPLAASLSPYRWPLRWPWTPLFGALFAGVAVALLRSPFEWRPLAGLGPYVAALIGGVAGAVYGLRVRYPRVRSLGPRSPWEGCA
ncbi:MAG TPA: hypothetical protein VIE39_08345 [Thermoanaerobaculia bacterium]|jgi:hypothetical protein